MLIVDVQDAQISLESLVEAIELGREREIVIARNGRSVAKLVPLDAAATGLRLGVAKGLFEVPDDIDAHNDEVARLFAGEGFTE